MTTKIMTTNGEPNIETSGQRLVYFAAERTHLAWVRTALTLMGFGFVVDRFGLFLQQTVPEVGPDEFSLWTGTGLILLGVLTNVFAAIRYLLFVRRYRREGRTEPGHGLSISIFASFLIALAGIVLVILLIRVTA